MKSKIGVYEVLADPSTSYWLRDAIRSAFARDPLDAVRDAELLHALLAQRLDALNASHQAPDAGLH